MQILKLFNRRFSVTFWLVFATLGCAMLVLIRLYLRRKTIPNGDDVLAMIGIGSATYAFLVWNLLLAWIPYLAAAQVMRLRQASWLAMMPWLLLWLAFLPNAPYIITDLIHLQPVLHVPLWYDAGMLFASAFTGLMLGLFSLILVRKALVGRVSVLWANTFVFCAIVLSGFGIWIGRFLRWNSWDVVTRPNDLLLNLAEELTSRHGFVQAFGTTALLSSIVMVGYGCLMGSHQVAESDKII